MSGRGIQAFREGPGAIPRKMFLRMLAPTVVSALALALSDIADALVVGNQVGESGLATIGLATPVYLLYNLLGVGFACGGGITHSRLTAAEDRKLALCHCRKLSAWLLLIGTAIAVLGNLFPGQLLTCLGAGEDTPALRELLGGYVQPLVTAAPLFLLNFLLYYFVRNDDNQHLASVGFSAGCILDLTLNILFVIVMKQGVKGAILSTIISQAVSVLILSAHLFFAKKGILRLKAVFRAHVPGKQSSDSCRASLRTGFSSAVSSLFQFIFLLLGNHLLMAAGTRGTIDGELAVAVFDFVTNCSFVTVSMYQAAAESMQPLAATFSVEHDRPSLRCLLKITIISGLAGGLTVALAIWAFAAPVAGLFGLTGSGARALAVRAARIFLLSTPISGLLLILISYDQSTNRVKTAALGTLLRSAVFLLPMVLVLGIFLPAEFWWIYLVTEALSLAVLLPVRRAGQKKDESRMVPVLSRTMTNDNRELGSVVEDIKGFCEANGIAAETSNQLQLAVEELCAVTMLQAFTGRPGEYIRVTLAVEEGSRYILHIRNSAPYFNPLDMRTGRVRPDAKAEIMDSIGVMMIRKKAKAISYRNYQGYNVMTVEY